MGDKKNIDRLFQEQFKNFEVSPNDTIWENIQTKLDEDRKRKKNIPLWMVLGGIAASLLLLATISVTLFTTGDIKNEVVDVSKDENSIIKDVFNTETKGDASEIRYNKNTTDPVVYSNSNGFQDKLLEKEVNTAINKQLKNVNSINLENVHVVNNAYSNKNSSSKQNSGITTDNNTKPILKDSSFNKSFNVLRNTTVVQNSTSLKSENKLSRLSDSDEGGAEGIMGIANNKADFEKENIQFSSSSITDKELTKKFKDGFESIGDDKLSNIVNNNVSKEGDVKENEQIANNKVGFDKGKTQLNSSIPAEDKRTNKFTDRLELVKNNTQDVVVSSNVNNANVSVDKNSKNTTSAANKVVEIGSIENDYDKTDSKNVIASSESGLDKEKNNDKEDSEEQEQPVEKTIEAAVAELKIEEDKNKDNEEEDVAFNKWKIAPNIAPVYYNSLNGGSPIDSQLAENKKKGQLTTSYGLGVGYAVNKRLTIRTGLNKIELGYDTQDVSINLSSETSGGPRVKNINLAPGAESLNIVSSNSFSVAQIPSSFSSLFDSSLNQRLGYLEVPLELSYNVSDKKMKINVVAGVSTFFLNKNEIYTETNGKTTFIGEANNLNKMSYSTNIGLGFNYKIAKAFNFNFEPMFKYQLNAFSNDSGNFKPYILGVYSGFSYKF